MGALTCQLEMGLLTKGTGSPTSTILPKDKGLSGLYGLYGLLGAAAARTQEQRSPVFRFF